MPYKKYPEVAAQAAHRYPPLLSVWINTTSTSQNNKKHKFLLRLLHKATLNEWQH